jgi:hypothetical protein
MNRQTPILLSAGMVLGFVVTAVGAAAANPKALPWNDVQGQASAPVISYQGQVAVNGTPYTGVGYLKFAIIDLGASTTYWTNDGQANQTGQGVITPTASVSLTVTNGLFNVLLGDTSVPGMSGSLSTATFNDTTDRALRVWFSADDNTYYRLAPDRRITWAPLALVAQQAWNADTIDGLHALDLLRLDFSASNITTGNLSTTVFSAYADLQAENYLNDQANDLAQNDGVLQPNLNADRLDGLHANALRPLVATTAYAQAANLGTTCQSYPSNSPVISLAVPGSGTIVVEATTQVVLATDVNVILAIAETQATCGTTGDAYPTRWFSGSPHYSLVWNGGWSYDLATLPYTMRLTLPVRRSFTVTGPGTHTFYLSGLADTPTTSTNSWQSADVIAQYYP